MLARMGKRAPEKIVQHFTRLLPSRRQTSVSTVTVGVGCRAVSAACASSCAALVLGERPGQAASDLDLSCRPSKTSLRCSGQRNDGIHPINARRMNCGRDGARNKRCIPEAFCAKACVSRPAVRSRRSPFDRGDASQRQKPRILVQTSPPLFPPISCVAFFRSIHRVPGKHLLLHCPSCPPFSKPSCSNCRSGWRAAHVVSRASLQDALCPWLAPKHASPPALAHRNSSMPAAKPTASHLYCMSTPASDLAKGLDDPQTKPTKTSKTCGWIKCWLCSPLAAPIAMPCVQTRIFHLGAPDWGRCEHAARARTPQMGPLGGRARAGGGGQIDGWKQ